MPKNNITKQLRDHSVLLILFLLAGVLLTLAFLRIESHLHLLSENTTAQKQIAQKQLQIAQKQLDLVDSQLAIAREQLAVSKESLDTSQETLQLTRTQFELVQSQYNLLEQSLATQRRVLNIAELLLQETRELNRKTPAALKLVP